MLEQEKGAVFEIVESAFRALPPPLADVTNMEGESRGVPSAPAGSGQLESGQLARPGGAACKQKKVFSLSSDADVHSFLGRPPPQVCPSDTVVTQQAGSNGFASSVSSKREGAAPPVKKPKATAKPKAIAKPKAATAKPKAAVNPKTAAAKPKAAAATSNRACRKREMIRYVGDDSDGADDPSSEFEYSSNTSDTEASEASEESQPVIKKRKTTNPSKRATSATAATPTTVTPTDTTDATDATVPVKPAEPKPVVSRAMSRASPVPVPAPHCTSTRPHFCLRCVLLFTGKGDRTGVCAPNGSILIHPTSSRADLAQ